MYVGVPAAGIYCAYRNLNTVDQLGYRKMYLLYVFEVQ